MNGATWFDAAACAGDNPYNWDTSTPYARKVCASCPVQKECLTYAMTNEAGYGLSGRGGMYGGFTPEQRTNLARKHA